MDSKLLYCSRHTVGAMAAVHKLWDLWRDEFYKKARKTGSFQRQYIFHCYHLNVIVKGVLYLFLK